jgi:carotenoid cleavage dioxygenase-like enzyme
MSDPAAWFRALAGPAEEFGPTPLEVRSGRLPPGLRGTLYRNGAGRLGRGDVPVGHWFDGDGAVLAVRFDETGATGTYRYVHTAAFEEEERAGQLLYGNYGMLAPGSLWNRWQRPLKNAANTSVLALSDRLLALWEGGQPHALDLTSLETRGLDDLAGPAGQLADGAPFSAHPKRDPQTGAIYNFGVSIGYPHATLRLYRCDPEGRLRQQGSFRLDGVPFVHDFALCGRYLVFLVPPVRVALLPLLLGLRSYSESMRWLPKLGTSILVFDRDTMELVARGETDPWFQWHFGNGAEYNGDDARIVLDFARYPDFAVNRLLAEVVQGEIRTPARAALWRLTLDPRRAAVLDLTPLCERSLEFPVVAPDVVGRPWRRTFFVTQGGDSGDVNELFHNLACFDHPTGTLTEAELGQGRYPSEALIAQDSDAPRRWLLSVVYDSEEHASEVWVFDADRLDERPACVLGLPSVVPLSFHGTWRPEQAGD